MQSPVFFAPPDGWVGDVIPFEQDGELSLFYLLEQRTTPKPGTSWHVATTTDLVHLTDRGVALRHGGVEAADFNAYTGCVVEGDDGVHHLFYTGQNPRHVDADGRPLQLVMHATSANGTRSWTKHPEDTFGAAEGYETADWRDPFVFRDGASGPWRMLIAARHRTGPERRRGVIAQCVSGDLRTWSPVEPFWDPRRYITHECPEVFKLGDWWYLVNSEFSDSFLTRYRMSRNPDGPWSVPDRDTVDGRAFYAAKSAAWGARRLLIGWIATREGGTDDGAWQWAGTMSILEAVQNADGTLGFCLPVEIVASFDAEVAPTIAPAGLEAHDGYTSLVGGDLLPGQCYIRAALEFDPGTTECGLLLRTTADGDQGYVVRLEPRRGRMVFDRWPRRVTGSAQWQVSGDVPFDVALERPADLSGGRHVLEVVLDGDLAVVVLNREICLSTRIYDHTVGRLGVFVGEGAAKISDVHVFQRSSSS